ncbi:sigma 54 modulation/S30EA ribosomal C-terminal domain-containing protein [Nocardia australiensis]|uniref:sigma 54 modulation/S30EA ribosomal C-terminal domain-containing protein n=1 Tax=Nocardia australiensis TaxID=2887191 RepID=UPI001D158047|nr:sigma 54 modulation/S30EA ribosomal C-terminal domain-containing protein [Nocardia australiensis]
MYKSPSHTRPALPISIGPHVPDAAVDYAREKIGHALDYASEPVLLARVRLTAHADPAVENPIVAQANVNMGGRAVRVQVTAATALEAVDLLQTRLRSRLQRLSRHWEAVRGGRPVRGPHEWRHGDLPAARPPYFQRPAELREVVRRKSFALATETCDEAAFDMELMDYEFHLFTESGSHVDSVLYRNGDTGYRLAQVDPRPRAVTSGTTPITISLSPAPVLSTETAIERLELAGWPFVFFCDRDLNRGCVLYHRYDGHYGLITPIT